MKRCNMLNISVVNIYFVRFNLNPTNNVIFEEITITQEKSEKGVFLYIFERTFYILTYAK